MDILSINCFIRQIEELYKVVSRDLDVFVITPLNYWLKNILRFLVPVRQHIRGLILYLNKAKIFNQFLEG